MTDSAVTAHTRSQSPRHARIPVTMLVLVAAMSATAFKLHLAATSSGTNDVEYWTEFAAGVKEFGPIGIYGEVFTAPYNHPPLAGWWLYVLNIGQDLGIGLPLLLRIPATLADAVTCWLVYRLVSERTSLLTAGIAAAGVVWSPVLVVISGFHGNTDPVFVALTIGSFYLLARRDRPIAAGVCLGLAVSVKLVPVVAVPWLLVIAFRRGTTTLVRYALGGLAVFMVLWVPVLVKEWADFSDGVLGYQGISLREWGFAELVQQQGYPGVDLWLVEHSYLVVAVAAVVPLLVWVTRHPHHEVIGLGMALVTMLLLTPSFGMQYLSWALAAAYLVSVRAAWAYNVAASLLVLSVYSLWSGGGWPWQWDVARGAPFTMGQLMLMAGAWACLFVVWIDGFLAPDRNLDTTTTGEAT